MTPARTRSPSRTMLWTATALVALVLAAGVGIAARGAPAATDLEMGRTIQAYAERAARAEALRGAAELARSADSVRGQLAQHAWGSDSLLVLASPALPAWRRTVDERLLRRAFGSAAPHEPGARVAVAILMDEPRRAGVARRPRGTVALLPPLVDGRTCLVVIWHGAFALSGDQQRWAARLDSSGDRHGIEEIEGTAPSLGACGWWAALGRPGRGVRAWLDSTGWRGAFSARFVPPGTTFAPWRLMMVERGAFLDPFAATARGLAEGGLEAQACASGNRAACRNVLHRHSDAAPDAQDGVLLPPRDLADVGSSGVFAADPRGRLLDDLWNEFGPAAMRALWRDERPFEEAFAAATGRPLDRWAEEWMRRSIRDPRVPAGPMLPARAFIVPLLVAALALAIALRGAARMGLTPVR